MGRPGRPALTAAQNRMLGNADTVQTLHIALALARTEADAQRNQRGSNYHSEVGAHGKS